VTEVAGTSGQLIPKMVIKQQILMFKNFHRILTTVVRVSNDTSETANITDTIFNRKRLSYNAAIDISVICCKYYHLFLLKMVLVIFAVSEMSF